jgi:hypothetical protein
MRDDGAEAREAILSGSFTLIEQATPEQEAASLLQTSWKDGKEIVHETWDVVRARVRAACP